MEDGGRSNPKPQPSIGSDRSLKAEKERLR